MTSSWANNATDLLHGGGGPRTQDYSDLLPTLLSNDGSGAAIQHDVGSHPADVFFGHQGNESGNTPLYSPVVSCWKPWYNKFT